MLPVRVRACGCVHVCVLGGEGGRAVEYHQHLEFQIKRKEKEEGGRKEEERKRKKEEEDRGGVHTAGQLVGAVVVDVCSRVWPQCCRQRVESKTFQSIHKGNITSNLVGSPHRKPIVMSHSDESV